MSSSTLPTLVQDSPPAGSEGSHETEGARLDSGLSGLDKPAPLPAFPVSKAFHPLLFDSPFATGAQGLRFGASPLQVTSHGKVISYQGRAGFRRRWQWLHRFLSQRSRLCFTCSCQRIHRLPACPAQAPPPHPAPLPSKHVTSFSLRPRPLPFLHFPLGGRRGLGVLKSSDFLLLSAPASLPPATMSSGSRSPRSLLGNHLISSPPPPPAFNQPASRQRGTCAVSASRLFYPNPPPPPKQRDPSSSSS